MPEQTTEAVNHTHTAPPPRLFVDAASGHYFCGDEDRQQKLDLLTHQIPYGGIILLWGEPGIGKTALLAHLDSRVNEFCRVCRLDGRLCDEPRQFVTRLLECFRRQSDNKQGADGSPLRALRDHLEILQRNGHPPVLMIDDADRLPDAVFDILEQLLGDDGEKRLTLLLAGSADLKKRMASPVMQPLAAHLAHEFELSPFSAEEQAAYVRARLNWGGMDDMGPFHTATLKFIYAASRGVPRRVNELAQVFLDNRKADGDGGRTSSPRHWRRQLRYVLPIVLISVGVAVFNEPIREALFPAADTPVAADARSGQRQLALTLPPATTTAADGPEATAEDDRPQHNTTVTQNSPPVPAAEPDGGQATATPPATLTKSIAATLAQADSGAGEAAPGGAPNSTAAARRPVPEQGQNSAAAAAEHAGTEPAAAIEPASRTSEPGIDRGQWWLSQPADQYAVQLMAAKDSDVSRYLRQHGIASAVTAYRVSGPDKALVAVAVGPFASKDEAHAQALQWQQRLPGIHPWVRSVASIQQTVRDLHPLSTSEWLARVEANERRLLAAPADTYAVQLLALNRKGVTDFVARHGLSDKVVYFRTRVDGKERYVALIEDFTDRGQAEAAGARIAASLKGVHPWVRSLASVQQAIRGYEDHPR